MSESLSIFRSLLPEDVAVAAAALDSCVWPVPFPEEWDVFARSVPNRQREFAAGRYLARQALVTLGAAAEAIPVGPQRAPLWPQTVIGSITHGSGECAACVGWRELYDGLGIDCEAAQPFDSGLRQLVMSPAEADGRPAAVPPELWPVLVFSIKEAAFKAYHALIPQFLGFEDLSVRPTRPGHFDVTTCGAASCHIAISCRGAWSTKRVFAAAWIPHTPNAAATTPNSL